MRDYAKVSGAFWIGGTGKELRGDAEAQVVALYLMTSPHANMIGLFHCPILYVAHEIGLSLEGASKGLRRCVDVGFCDYDEVAEVVWVIEAAKFQIADRLSANDKQTKGIANELARAPRTRLAGAFAEKYRDAFHLPEGLVEALRSDENGKTPGCPLEASSEPLRSQEQEQEQKQEQEQEHPPSTPRERRSGGDPPGFDRFWAKWPRKEAKVAAAKAWRNLAPNEALQATILDAIAKHAATEQWLKEGGKFVPLPATWLNGRRWEDELPGRTGQAGFNYMPSGRMAAIMATVEAFTGIGDPPDQMPESCGALVEGEAHHVGD